MKKAICIFLALVMCLSLCACGGGSQPEENKGQEPSKETVPIQTEPIYDNQDLAAILEYIGTIADSTEEPIENEAKELDNKLGDTYETYDSNKEAIPATYSSILEIATEAFNTLQTAAADAYSCVATQGLDDYDTWDDAMGQVYDALDEEYGDIYDILDETYGDIYDSCDTAFQDAYDVLDYEEASELWEKMYDDYWAAWEEMYDFYWAAWEEMYDIYWNVWSGFSSGNADIDSLISVEKDNSPSDNTSPAESDEENESTAENGMYSNKVYRVGNEIPVGTYVIECTDTDNSMEVVVFASEADYEDFQNAEKFTIGEYSRALEAHAWINFYLEKDEQVFVGLKKGYVVLLDDGMCEFNKYQLTSDSTLYSGIYLVGEDLTAGSMDIRCTSERMQVNVFESNDHYLNYHKTERFTIGEESDALEANAVSVDYVYNGDAVSLNLKDGMIVVIEEGYGSSSVDSGPIINDDTEEDDSNEGDLVNGLRPDFKEAMDAYEAFYDEYCEFMESYKENPTDMTLIVKYGELLVEMEKMNEAFEAWDEDELNDAELKYYLEVNNRVMQKLVDVAG